MKAFPALLLGLAVAAPALGGVPDPRTLRVQAAGSFDPKEGVPTGPLPRVDAYAPGVRGAYWVQLSHPIRASDREALEAAGASVKGSVPVQALEVVMSEAERAAVEAVPGVRAVLPTQPGLKLAPGVAAELGARGQDPARRLLLQVVLLPGEDAPAAAQLAAAGARVVRIEPGRSQAVATVDLPAARLEALARVPLVRFVEPVYRRRPHNDRARLHSGMTLVADDTFSAGLDPSLDGFDQSFPFQVRFGHLDGGLSTAHPDFATGVANGWITVEPGANLVEAHGTHTAGSVVGDGGEWSSVPAVPPGSGAISPARWRGAAPEAALHHISFQNDYTDAEALKRFAEEDVDVSTNSWGYCLPKGPTRCDSITDYNTNAAAWDDGVWDANPDVAGLQPLVAVFSAGNDGDGGSNGCTATGSDQVGSPGTAKNVITVGANETDRGCNVWADRVGDVIDFSSRGPVDPDGSQGLFKPDVVQIGGDFVLSTEAAGSGGSGRDAPSACSDTGPRYRYEAGTSMSCPLAAGLTGLLVQDLVVNRAVAAPPPSLVKGLLVHGAADLSPSGGCDYTFETDAAAIHQGWGFVQAAASLYGPGGTPERRAIDFEAEVTADALATGGTYQRTVQVPSGVPFKVTLVWTDYPAAAGAGSPLVVNDLDLEVVGPEGLFLGNNFAGNGSVASTVRATPDRYNVVENVYLASAAGGSYDVRVRGHQVSQDQEPGKPGVNQDFSLVWSFPPVPACGDGLDDDGDGLVDLADPGCADALDDSERSAALPCDDGLDDDGDTLVDFVFDSDGDGISDPPGDPVCRSPSYAREASQCQDGLDNDGQPGIDFDGGASRDLDQDGFVDAQFNPATPPVGAADPQCVGKPWLNAEKAASRCGLGFELAFLAPLLARLRRRARSRRRA